MEQDLNQMARHVRGVYNYQVGQKAGLGMVILVVGIAAGAMFLLASLGSMAHQIFEGLRQMSAH